MHLVTFSFVSLSACLLASSVFASNTPSTFDLKKFKSQDIIKQDVAVIGGGSAGTYSAISLKDKGKSVIVIEKKDRLGGHTETYIDPTTGTPIDMGVMIWHNITVVKDYFKRFDISITHSTGFFQSVLNYDFSTGKAINLSFTPSDTEISAAFAAYTAQYSKYPELKDGTFLPSPVPEELYIPFGEFVQKYGLQAAVPTMFNYNPGVGDILANPTLEQFRYWGLEMVQDLSTGFLTTAHHNSSELYTKAEVELSSSSSLLLNSVVGHADRGEGGAGIKLVVRTPQGNKLILAKKLLIAIPPKLDFLAPLDLSNKEKTLFGKFIDAGYYVGIVKNTGFPDNNSISNAAQNSEYNFPSLPGPYSFAPAGLAGLQMVTYATPQSPKSSPLPDATVKADIILTIKRLQKENPDKFSQTEPKFVDFRSHAPYTLQVGAGDIKDGFYEKLYALQGLRNTHWTGEAFRAEDSSLLWQFSEEIVLPGLLAGL
ncbi:FAD dependent oxidoreductase [Penicillium psychrosexuale]|uniref:FAD dependent oxidoreductase n=1 Tax=Penicillium psychrosexuale TaxID=1002107 RepID=UPI0025451CD3|nr:FAD dependent oxidoreductase [Penicillium psychrosexuale]KAJ5784025.1 FAD dependent oxidoreductase [Penicillium psychrosexuale]